MGYRKRLICMVLITVFKIGLAALPANVSDLIVFGDSLSDTGNFQPEVYFECLLVPAPMTDTVENGGDFGGKLWVNFLAESYHLDLRPASCRDDHCISTPTPTAVTDKISYNNWAYVGIEATNLATLSDKFTNQVNDYLTSVNQHADPNALYVVWAGSNDVLHLLRDESFLAADETHQRYLVARLLNYSLQAVHLALQKLYYQGARKFLVVGVPDISLTPFFSNSDYLHLISSLYGGQIDALITQYLTTHSLATLQAKVHELCATWNDLLFGRNQKSNPLQYLVNLHPEIELYTWDPVPAMQDFIAHPSHYGFPDELNHSPNNMHAYCGEGQTFDDKPDDFIFFNFIHPSAHTHKLLAEYVKIQALRLAAN